MADSGIRVGVVGVSGVGLAHLFAVSSLGDGVSLAAACDVDREAAEKAASDFGVPAFTDPADLFGSGEVDAVVVSVPPFLHGSLTTAALEAGLHVYCEKPLAPTVAECAALAERSASTGLALQVGFQYRFMEANERAVEMVRGGEIGEVHRARVVATNWFRPQHYFVERPWRGRWETAGGGVLMSQAIHQLDALIELVDLPRRVTATARRRLHDAEVEDDLVAHAELRSGGWCTIEASISDPVGADRIEVHGDRGSLVLEAGSLSHGALLAGSARNLATESTDVFSVPEVRWEPVVELAGEHQAADFAAIRRNHVDFIRSVRTGEPGRNAAARAIDAVALVNAVYAACVEGEPVDVPVPPEDYRRIHSALCAGEAAIDGGEA